MTKETLIEILNILNKDDWNKLTVIEIDEHGNVRQVQPEEILLTKQSFS